MDIFDLLLLVYLAFRNNVRAKLKGLNGWLWAGITVISFIFMFFVGILIVVFNFCADKINLNLLSGADQAQKELLAKQMSEAILGNPLHLLTIQLFGVGGYLIIRYILEKKPNKKQPEIHWMDRLGENR